jgi:acetyltransferase-like isoleucine patch superfamily enzyme
MVQSVKFFFKYLILRVKYGSKVKFDFPINIGIKSNFEGMNKIFANTSFDGNLGFGSYIGVNSKLNGKFKIGKFTSIASFVSSNPGMHPYTFPFVSTSPAFVSLGKQNGNTFTKIERFNEIRYADKEKKFNVIIGNDCWIGEKVFIVGGVTIGDGAVVLAGAVVTKDIPSYAIYGGVPAKFVKYRYDEETIKFLLDFKWWDQNKEWFENNIELMVDVKMLLKKYK